MPTALPRYLGTHFDTCPPGHRFGLYFDGWESGWRKPANKTPAFKKVADAFPDHTRKALEALRKRQQAAADALGDETLSHPARLFAPLATGLGNEHPLENGFAFLNPYGLPYLAGSGVKGVLRRAAEELAGGEWGETSDWSEAKVTALFGLETESGDNESERTRGALVFWDLFFEPARGQPTLAVEIMTPHHTGYIHGTGTPHANEPPNPIPFLAVPAGSECTLHVQCNAALIPPELGSLRENWKTLIAAAIEHAGEWLGFGAKSAVGYGRLGQDEKTRREAEDRAEELAKAAEEEKRQAVLGRLSPEARAVAQFVAACQAKTESQRKDPCSPGSGLYADALRLSKQALADGNPWSADDRAQLAAAFQTWLPQVIEKLERPSDWKDARKKLKLAALKGE